MPAPPALGEGSVDLSVGADNRGRNLLGMYGSGQASASARNQYTILRVYARAGETIQMGSSAMQLTGGEDNIRVYPPGTGFASSTDPTARAAFPGDPVFASHVFDCNVDHAGTGRIATRAEELAGPGPGSWTPCEFVAPADGIYPIVMYPSNSSGPVGSSTVGTPNVTTGQRAGISIWDVTVRDTGGVVQPGRLFSNRLSLWASAPGFPVGIAPNTAAYLYTPSGYQYRIDFFDHRGELWQLAGNDRGVVDAATGERLFASFQWGLNDSDTSNTLVHTEAVAPHLSQPDTAQDSNYPIFLREPDPVAVGGPEGLASTRGFATAPLAPSDALSGLSFSGAAGEPGGTARGAGGTIGFSSPAQMEGLDYTVEIDLDQSGTFGDGSDVVDDSGELSSGGNSFAWDGRTADGAMPECGTYPYRVRSTLAEVHLTMSDVESSDGTQIERLSLPGDPALGDPFAASYDDIDPYKGTAVTNASPSAVEGGTSGPTFHGWTGSSGNVDFVDTWMRLPELVAAGALEVRCAQEPVDPPPETPVGPPPGVPVGPPPARAPDAGRARQRARLVLRKRVDRSRVRAGSRVTFAIRARNHSRGVARRVRVCDRLPAGLVVVRATPRGRLAGGSYCWKVRRLPGRSSKSLRLTVSVLPGVGGRILNRAVVTSANARPATARRAIRVVGEWVRGGGVTG
ncbi:MAG TPA: hypothetical protein VHF90_09645 [Thermoleophilaceae bacterium]|nr:hypothetical protein [Thermoleophilaceae bacterium]